MEIVMNKILPRSAVLSAPAAPHGAFDYDELERLGLNADEVIDFSVNSNAYGPSPTVRNALGQIPLDRYPDRESLALRRALATRLKVGVDQIVVGNGTAELVSLIALAFLQPHDKVLVIRPTFPQYHRVSMLMGVQVLFFTAQAEHEFAIDSAV